MLSRSRTLLVCTSAALLLCGGCSQEDKIADHRKAFESLGATTVLIGQAWLGGDVSGTYARTALESTFTLVEQERARLARQPETVADPAGATLSRTAEHLSRLVAQLTSDVTRRDASAVRSHLAEIPILPISQP